ncbi:myelin-associated glycoprotein-like [Trematomus bernacchii]|uniref:myelin-associated glycoprotein-like n=1 Tax=Trematomus bernacchii TaxID=40690 RepID=UPI00146A7001|nr:myelin-associated glycoprotein-like [Trematomus bernacchii]
MGTALLFRLLSLFTGISMLQQVISWSITVPNTVTAVEGSCVVVPCQTQPHSRVIWYQYHTITYPVVYDGRSPNAVEEQFRGRTSIPGEASEGNCSLMIDNVKTSDNNLQTYVWIKPDSESTQKFHLKTVTISVERRAIKMQIQKRIVNGEMFQANCSVKHSCPSSPPSLHWNKSQFLNDSTSMTNGTLEQAQRWHTETLHGLATYKMHNSKMWCSAKFKTFTSESERITLNILYEPVNVTLTQQKESVMEGGSVTLECGADCNPQPHTYKWLRRQMGQIKGINSTEKKRPFNNITRDTSFSCIAYNDIGTRQSDWLDLDVQYAPVIVPESYCLLTGESLKCVCSAEASPYPSIHWTIDGNYTLPSSFSFVSTNKKNVVSGEINCAAQRQSNISCTATNYLGSNTKLLSVERSSTYIWLLAFVIPGIGLLFGSAMFICRKRSRNRPPAYVVCNTDIVLREQRLPHNAEQEERYGNIERPPAYVVCNTDIVLREQRLPDNAEQEERYGNIERFQAEDMLSPCGPDKGPDEDSFSCVYDNEFLEDMKKTNQSSTAPQ